MQKYFKKIKKCIDEHRKVCYHINKLREGISQERKQNEKENKEMLSVKVKIYDEVKYNKNSKKVSEVEYKNIRGFEVVTGKKAEEIASETDKDGQDEFNEYLVIILEDGSTCTFRNSHVDLFRI